ncbi:MAG TPA: ATP-binding protein [Kofleriaceae bacterium]|nr:ATP-binding protein [Kofleriaceae bacterium]
MVAAFALIAVMLGLLELLQWIEGRDTRANIEEIQDNALVSLRLVDRIGGDVARERILIGRHIFETQTQTMSDLEHQIDAVRADYEEAAREYSPFVTFPGEPYAWHELSSDIATAREELEPALALSRENRDAEATRIMTSVDPLYDRIAQDQAALVEINEAAAAHAVANVRHLQLRAMVVRLAVTAIVLLTVVVVGFWLTRAVIRGQRQLVEFNAALENRNRELDAFAGRVAHDLRGPLSTIGLAASMLAERAAEPVATTAIIERGVTQIANLIEDLLALSRIGSMPMAFAEVAPVARTLTAELEPLVTRVSGTLTVDLEPAEVACGEGLLRQALWNLGENAVKYRRVGVALVLELRGRIEGDRYVIRVSDNASGMSEEDARHAFEPFFRSDRTRSVPGTGLGLAIVRRIVEASGGNASLSSKLGDGTTFVLALPLAPPERGVAGAIASAQPVSA